MSKKSDGHGVLLGRTHINISYMHSMDSEIRWSLSAQIQETLRRKGKSEPRGAETGLMPKKKKKKFGANLVGEPRTVQKENI